MTDDRTPFREARAAGKARHQEHRLTAIDLLVIRRALEHLPATCRYHGENLAPGHRMLYADKACCDTGKPALARREAEAALERLTP